MNRLSKCSLGLLLLLVLPLTTHAQNVSQYLTVGDTDTVTRGQFIRAAVRAAKLPTPNTGGELPYRRIPKSLEPYIRAANNKNAIDPVFGRELLLARPISRGEAAAVLTFLFDVRGGAPVDAFTDVKPNTVWEQAARAAITRQWMDPLDDNTFGIARVLTGREGKQVIARVLGFDPSPAQNITTQPRKRTTPTRSTVTVPTLKVNFERAARQSQSVRTKVPGAQILEAVWQLIQKQYLYQDKIDGEDAGYDAIEALVKSLDDPYTSYLRPARSKSFQTQINGQVSGIGAQVEDRDGILTVVTPLRGSPAKRAGIKPGDEILTVDGESIIDVGFQEAVEKVRGPKGSRVILGIRRNGIQMEVEVVRDDIKVPEIEIDWRGNVAVVQLLQFGRLTKTELRPMMQDVQKQGPSGIVLDLRNNPGGLLHAAERVLSNFVPKGTVVAQIKSKDEEYEQVTEDEPTINATVPVVVLINEGSASASEIVAGALQDHGRARVVGAKSFGKGTVQEVLQFTDDSSLKMTVAEWFTPQGNKIDGIGVAPDVPVEFSDRDDQLLRALDILR